MSVILPVLNEVENLSAVNQALIQALETSGRTFEIVYCDDGSLDGSVALIQQMAMQDERVKGIFLRRNFGQTAAITAGVDHAVGEYIVLMDADGQNDPADISVMLEKLEEGYDLVSGWRHKRRDPFLSKKLPSIAANWLLSKVTGVKIHDSGCTLKAYRREILSGVSLYGEMHRFIAAHAHWMGARTCEVEVRHHPRTKGKSKYSIFKTFKVILDIPVLMLLGSYLTRPAHFFGGIGIVFFILAFLAGVFVVQDKLFDPESKVHRNPMLLICFFFALTAIQMVMMGLLAELLTRAYHESQNKKTYVIKETINLKSF